MDKMRRIKNRRRLRFYRRAWWEFFVAPVKSYEGFSTAIFVLILVFFAKQGLQEIVMEVWGSTFFWAFIVFLLWCSIAAASKVSKEEKQKGQLNKNKFVYHTPLHVLTREVSPKDNGKKFKFKCKDVEPNSFVEFKVESENSNEFLIKVGIGGEKQDIPVICHPTCKLGVRIGEDKSLCLVTELFPETESSIIRVTVLSWKI